MSNITRTPDEFEAILSEAIRRTGVGRYRYLCLEHPDPAIRAGYRETVRGIIAGPSPPAIAVDYGAPAASPGTPCCGG